MLSIIDSILATLIVIQDVIVEEEVEDRRTNEKEWATIRGRNTRLL